MSHALWRAARVERAAREAVKQRVRERTERALQQALAFQRAILDSASYAIIATDKQGVILTLNPAAERMLGYSATEVEGKATPLLFHDQAEMSQRAAALSRELGEPIGAGFEVFTVKPRRDQADENEWTYVRKDGVRVPVRLSITALRDVQGEITGYLGIASDITEHKRAQQAILEHERRFRAIFDQTFEFTGLLSPDGTLLEANQTALDFVGAARSDVVGRSFWETPWWRISQEVQDRLRLAISEAAQGRFVRYEIEAFGVDDSLHILDFSLKPVYDERGEVVLLIPEGRDITERRQAEAAIERLNRALARRAAELESVNRELESFSYSVSHDLRAPLRSIDGFSQVLLEDYADRLDEDGRDALRRVRAASQRMAQLIDDILKLSRLSRAEMHREPVDLSAIARTIADELRWTEPKREVEFVIADGVTARADARLLRVALENLLGNAWKYTARHPRARIEFGTERGTDGSVVYLVRDDGAGFDMAYAGKLFGAFQRLHGDAEFPGSGVGLTSVQRIVHRHGGEVWAEGAVEGGATFRFTLPDERAAAYPMDKPLSGEP
ncbi:sensor histidine kinase [Aromatoleum toluclasticum]|uniref:sensor histidine kinase n=1 Tax=Aromatoleum toluclasticum TaxID=92003 RepID=UPI000A0558CE|nr:PAS domain S-box protein [Aromatoleum toluclasticum]